MTGHCPYRSPVAYVDRHIAGSVFDRPPDAWLCACPAGDYSLGTDCIDDHKKCNIARKYDREGLPSYAYKRCKAPSLKEVAGKE